ncbi:RnfH family protein [Methylomonas sp. MED-D]|uniref:RnfH family protein n=1 Tax=Methylomonas sp. MED-D TaxID=3418768 RepID=UPI003D08FA2E
MRIEVAYATPERQTLIALTLPPDATAEQAIQASGILARHPEIDLTVQKFGIFGIVAKPQAVLADGDRVEIYRPLKQNPMDARRDRLRKT